MVVATDAAFFKAVFVTNNGSIIPDLIISQDLPVITFIPQPGLLFHTTLKLAFSKIVLKGCSIASNKICSASFFACTYLAAFNNATPPPETIPSFIAALVANIASSTL